MAFDYRKFESNASFGSLARDGCSREVLKHAASRYAVASMLPGERRKGLRQAGISKKQLKAQAAAATCLAGFLGRLQQNPQLVAGNALPQQFILCLRKDLKDTATLLESLRPFRPDAKEAAGALALYVKQRTGQQHLPEIVKLLNGALAAAGLPGSLTAQTLQKQIARANRQRAEALLEGWESFAPPAKTKK